MATHPPQAHTPVAELGAHTLEDVLRLIESNSRFLLVSHARPDGDAIGSLLACSMLLRSLGKHSEIVSADRVPPLYRFLPCSSSIQHLSFIDPSEAFDAVILLECDSIHRSRIRGLEGRHLVNIDHHFSGRPFAHINWIDPSASSVGQMIYALARRAGVPVSPDMATCLYTALLTDTGCFCYQATDTHTFALAEELVQRGANPSAIAAEVYFSNPASKMRLLGAALATLHIEDHLASIVITCEDMARSGSPEEDCEGLVNYAIGIENVHAAVFLRELPNGKVRASLRSKDAADAPSINVAAIAEHFGGGGHQHASGCEMPGPLLRARDQVLDCLRPLPDSSLPDA